VEGHGTGTALGDPIEAQALLATYGQGRDPEHPLWLGSLKSNIGHTQAAAGVSSVIKMVEALRHGVMPPTLHAQEPTTEVDWTAGAIELLSEAREWPRNGHPRRAGVSSFGISGTNAHLILEEAPEEAPAEEAPAADEPADEAPVEEKTAPLPAPGGLTPLVVSAHGEGSLAGQAGRLAAYLDAGPQDPSDTPEALRLPRVAKALLSERALLRERAVVLAGSHQEALDGLGALARGDHAAAVITGRAAGTGGPGKVVWVFPGQGSQRAGAGRELYERYPVFARALDEACEQLEAFLAGWIDHPVRDVILGTAPGSTELLNQTVFTQAALFAVETALFRLLESWGVRPDAVVGHSIGEVAAAHAAGVLSLRDAARLVAARGRLMGELPGGGAMAALQASAEEVLPLLTGREHELDLAAVNGPTAVVVAGDAGAVDELTAHFAGLGRSVKRLKVSHAFHSPHMDAMLPEFETVVRGLTLNAPTIPVVSNLTGALADAETLRDPDHWIRHARRPVRFLDGLRALRAAGTDTFVELGPDAVLTAMTRTILDTDGTGDDPSGTDVLTVPVLRRGHPEGATLDRALATAHAHGLPVPPAPEPEPGPAAELAATLPTYPFERTRYWLDAPAGAAPLATAGLDDAGHPLLAATVELADEQGGVWTATLSTRTHPWLADHTLAGRTVVPGTALLELALTAAGDGRRIAELTFDRPLVLSDDTAVRLRVTLGAQDTDGSRPVTVHSAPITPGADWTTHATGRTEPAGPLDEEPFTELSGTWPPPGAEPVDTGDFYGGLTALGYGYGPAFQGLRAVWRRGDEVFAEAALPEEQRAGADRFGIHPALLDAALHAGMFGTESDTTAQEPGRPVLPFAWNGLELHAAGASALRIRLGTAGPGAVTLEAADETGGPVVSLDSLVSRPVSADQLESATDSAVADSLFQVDWTEAPAAQPALDAPTWAPVATADDVAELARNAGTPEFAVLDAVDADALQHPDAVLALTAHVLGVVQAWLAADGLDDSRLVVATRGAVPAGDGVVTDPAGAAVWGLVRSAQAENPDRIILIDADPAAADGVVPVLGAVRAAGEPQVAVRGTALKVPRLARAGGPAPESAGALTPQGTVLITGGTGSLGGLVARHLVARHGVRHLLLVSRRGPDAEGAGELVAELAEQGAAVTVAACDVSDREQTAALLARIPDEHPLRGVVHTAGVLDDGVIGALDAQRLAKVFAPKVDAVRHLDALTRGTDLDAFVVF
ncbi:SDR family NAD(P)-dependent oxidoreductase, partial [Nocardia asteroides]|uniref:SDR family NAD(P)-dependent oxidoreductase n=1 Tax=Nocardia asteroides TaxID=1824 RepID=UPI003646E4C2